MCGLPLGVEGRVVVPPHAPGESSLGSGGRGESINAQSMELSDDGDVQGMENKVDVKEDGGSERKRCTLLF